jgi:hypothetical protein
MESVRDQEAMMMVMLTPDVVLDELSRIWSEFAILLSKASTPSVCATPVFLLLASHSDATPPALALLFPWLPSLGSITLLLCVGMMRLPASASSTQTAPFFLVVIHTHTMQWIRTACRIQVLGKCVYLF